MPPRSSRCVAGYRRYSIHDRVTARRCRHLRTLSPPAATGRRGRGGGCNGTSAATLGNKRLILRSCWRAAQLILGGIALGSDLDAAVIRLANSGQWALLHGDPCPDNTIRTSSGLRFVDLEHACSGDGITQLAYLRIEIG